MVERKRIGLFYDYSPNWVAGAYYILNIIKAINELPNSEKPHIVIFHEKETNLDLIQQLEYDFVSYYQIKKYDSFWIRIINKFTRLIGFGIFFYDKIPSTLVDNYYPYYYRLNSFKKEFYWIPDFQESFYPEFFSAHEISERKKMQTLIVNSKQNVVFSSNDAKKTFTKLYPHNLCTLHTLQFASVLSKNYQKLSIQQLLKKFSINNPYFIISNQFWKHKNHITVLKAIVEVIKVKKNISFVFTGKPKDTRDEFFFDSLKEFCSKHKINEYVIFLGFIDRDEQLQLMNNSIAIIQPSLFEGWNTSVEDAKFLNKYLILSDLPVHKEQINQNVTFFNKENYTELASIILKFIDSPPYLIQLDYKKNIIQFARNFIHILS